MNTVFFHHGTPIGHFVDTPWRAEAPTSNHKMDTKWLAGSLTASGASRLALSMAGTLWNHELTRIDTNIGFLARARVVPLERVGWDGAKRSPSIQDQGTSGATGL